MNRFVAFALALCVCTASLVAQGTLTGKVTDGESGEALRGATIMILKTKKGAYSDVKGRFTVKSIPAGKYDVQFSYIGYERKIVQNVEIADGKTETVNAVLKLEKRTTKEVVVEAKRSMESQAAVLTQRKNSAQVSDGVSKEEMKRQPDSDAGQALKRVSGVTVVGDKFVYVRGIGDRYNNTTLNGVTLTSTEPDKKAFAFDMFPSDLLENASIAKSFTPDLPGNFAGGLVQLSTVEFPSGYSLRMSVTSSANDNVMLRNNAFVQAPRSSTDFIAMDDGLRTQLPSALPANRRQFSELLSAIKAGDAEAYARWKSIGTQFNNGNLQREQKTVNLPNGSFSLSYGNLFQVDDNDFGVVASLNYSNSWSINNIARNSILADKSPLVLLSGTNSGRNVNIGSLVNLAYKLGDNSQITLKNVYNRSLDEDCVTLNGQDVGYQFNDLRQISFQYVEKQLFSSTLGGEHSMPYLGNIVLDWKAGYSQSTREEPDYRRMRYLRPTSDSSIAFTSDIISFQELGQGSGVYAGRFFSSLTDNAYNANFNVVIPVSDRIKIKTGALYEARDRAFSARSFTVVPGPEYVNLDQAVFALPESENIPNPSRIFANENFASGAIGYSEDSRLADAYSATENLASVYAMGDIPMFIGDIPFRAIIGARVENNTQQLNSFDLSDKPVVVKRDNVDVLPALSLVAKMSNEMNVRLSASQTLARPSLREFAPFTFYDFATQSQVQGNPDLVRSLIQNYDARWEWFPEVGEVVSAGVFYKSFKNAIEETIYLEQSNVARTFKNANGIAENYGVELELRKQLTFLGEDFKNFTFSANYSRVFSNIEVSQGGQVDKRAMWGQSPYSFNTALFFSQPDWGTSVNLSYNVIGRRIVLVGLRDAYTFQDPHTYERPRDVVDFSLVQKLSSEFDAKFVIRDVLNQPLVWEQGGEIVQSNLRGRTFSLGVSMKLN